MLIFYLQGFRPWGFHLAETTLHWIGAEIARNVVESQRLSTLIDYATAAPFAIGFLETALAIEDSSNGIWR